MLTLKGPIPTHISQPLTCGAEVFSEKIQGNYGLFGARIAPEELLFLLAAPPELPAEGGSMTTLVDQQTKIDVQSLNLDVVNHVINRILLDGSESFTYQDQVYVTTVLNRLGISDAAQFMAQVRQLRTESESTFHLLSLYRSELARYVERREAGEPVPALPLPAAEDAPPRPEDPRTALCMSILRRLDTANLYEMVCAFHQSWRTGETHFHRHELRIAEQLRFSGAVSLVENQQALYQRTQVQLLHHLNRYEAGTLLEPPENEEAVLTQAAAALLITAVDNALTVVLNRPQFLREQWMYLENALRQTAENSLSRFESYHTQSPPALRTLEQAAEAAWNRYAAELRIYQALRAQINPQAAEPVFLPFLPPEAGGNLFSLTHIVRQEPEKDGETLQSLPGRERMEVRSTERDRRLEALRILRSKRSVQETLRELRTQETEISPRLLPLYRTERETVRTQAAGWNGETQERVFRTFLQSREIQRLWPPRPTVERFVRQSETRFFAAEHLRELRQELRTIPPPSGGKMESAAPLHPGGTAFLPPPPAPYPPPLELTPQEAEIQAPETLLEVLQRIDQHNRYLQQAIRQEAAKQEQIPPASPDLRRTMRDALRALEEPEALEWLLPAPESGREHTAPAFTPEETALLKQAAPSDRTLYEAVLLYQKDPEAAMAKGLLRPGNLGALHAELQRALQMEPAELEHPGEMEPPARVEQTETVLEFFRQLPAVRPAAPPPAVMPRPAVQTVHRRTETAEELLERMETQRTRRTAETEHREEITRREVRETDVTQLERTMTARTTEDITELVNRALSRQMRTITDQVYRQMERRLQAERSRRGRF